MVGGQYGRLVVLREEGQWVVCKCTCGEGITARRGNVLAGYTKSCGCLRAERASSANTTHGLRRNRIYTIWRARKARCYNPRCDSYPFYGAKGIIVEASWHDFSIFCTDMGKNYSQGLSIDRIDPTKNYCKENCRWLPHKENCARGRGKKSC